MNPSDEDPDDLKVTRIIFDFQKTTLLVSGELIILISPFHEINVEINVRYDCLYNHSILITHTRYTKKGS